MRFVRQLNENTPRAQTRAAIKRMILSRDYKVGDRMPPYRELASQFSVALFTVERAMKELAAEGVIQLLHGKGAFIRQLPAREGQLRQIGLIYSGSRQQMVRAGYLREILAGVVEYCDQRSIDLQILAFWTAGQRTPVPPREVAMRVDGVILLEVLNQAYIEAFVREDVPLVLVDAQAWSAPAHAVRVDNAQAVDLLMDHLHAMGHRRIAYVDSLSHDILDPANPWVESADTRERRDAYLAAMQRLGLADQKRIYPPPSATAPQHLEQVALQLAGEKDRPTAVLAYDAGLANRLCTRLCELDVRVPHDLSVAGAVGAGDQILAGNQVLTRTVVSFEEMGRLAMETLGQQATGAAADDLPIQRVAAEMVVGATTGPARR